MRSPRHVLWIGVVLALTSTAAAGVAIQRKVVVATLGGWQASYTHEGANEAQMLLRYSGNWSYSRGNWCGPEGIGRGGAKVEGLIAPQCPPYSLVAQVEVSGQPPVTHCLMEQDHFALPPGTRVSFGINEAADATRDNAGVISLEILVGDTPRRGSQ